ncbi:MAG: acyl carrier protein [Hyphomicrobiaceae bacterium]|nr:acyl carrier protein [Hyphomicrobiaceae bacterium]
MNEIQATIVNTINNVCRPDTPDLTDADASLLSGAMDSLDFASVLMALEDEFELDLQDVDVEELNTLNKLVKYVESHGKF